jgi:4-amino-4-deoxy-L-arabinose transferase-like glycosyltransferase
MPAFLARVRPPDAKAWLLAILAAALLLRVRTAWEDLPTLVRDVTSDDAFYFFQIARNLATGRNVTFDGETLTNGFHPLWLLLVTPLHGLSDDPVFVLHAALTLAALLAVGTTLLIHASVAMLTGNRAAALLAAAFYGLHPYLVVESVNGLETALALFTLATSLWLFLRLALRRNAPTPGASVRLGLCAGLMMLSRTDLVFVLPPILLCLLVRWRWRPPLVTGAVATAVVMPWLIWNLVSFGTIVQVSSLALAEPIQQDWLAEHGDTLARRVQRGWQITADAFGDRLVHYYFVPRGGSRLPLLLAAAALLASLPLAPRASARAFLRRVGLVMIPGAGIVLTLLYHSAVRWWLREWYFAPMALLGALLLGLAVAYLGDWLADSRLAARRGPAAGLYAGVAAVLFAALGPHQAERWETHSPHRFNQLEAARWVADHTRPGARIGSFNAGILGYFSERTVVNLDGVVNADAYQAGRDGRLMEYVVSRRIDYLVDLRGTLGQARCFESRLATCRKVVLLGERVPAFGGGRIQVLEVVRERPASE